MEEDKRYTGSHSIWLYSACTTIGFKTVRQDGVLAAHVGLHMAGEAHNTAVLEFGNREGS